MIEPTKTDILAAIKDLDFDPPTWAKRPCDEPVDELDEETIAAIDADVTELCRQKYQQLAADYNFLAAKAGQLKSDLEFAVIDRDRFIDRSSRYLDKIQKQRRIIAVLIVALLVAVGIIAR